MIGSRLNIENANQGCAGTLLSKQRGMFRQRFMYYVIFLPF